MTADEAVNKEGKQSRRSVTAAEWLIERFRERLEWPSDTLFRAASQANVSRNAVFEAKKLLDLPKAKVTTHENGKTEYVWWVPADWPPLTPSPIPIGTPRDSGTTVAAQGLTAVPASGTPAGTAETGAETIY